MIFDDDGMAVDPFQIDQPEPKPAAPVLQAEKKASAAGDAYFFDQWYEWSNILVAPIYWWAETFGGVTKTYRVEPGKLKHTKPKSMYQYYKQFAAMDDATKSVGPDSTLYW